MLRSQNAITSRQNNCQHMEHYGAKKMQKGVAGWTQTIADQQNTRGLWALSYQDS